MSEYNGKAYFLLTCFAEFYEAVATIKLAIAEGRLPLLLRVGDKPPPSEAADLASCVSGLLAGVLRRQASRIARECTPSEIKAHRFAMYAMAALADEIFVLDVEWVGREAWLDLLLEYKLFHSRIAGRHFFVLIQRLIDTPVRGPLHMDLACVLLMVLQLGFKGQYRGKMGTGALHGLRSRLFKLLGQAPQNGRVEMVKAFPQAYQNLLQSAVPARLAPLTPWYIAAGVAAALYVVISTVVWFQLTLPFVQAVARS